MTRARFPLVALGLLTTALAGAAARAEHAWSTYHWERKSSSALILTIGDCHAPSIFNNWSATLSASTLDWDTFSGQYLTFVGGSCSSGNIKSYNDNYGDTGWLGLATISVTRGKDKHIVSGASQMNEFYVTYPGYDGFDEPVEWRHVLCQEIGHTFGLDHNREGATGGSPDDTCMNDQTRPLRYPSPNVHDTQQLDVIYAHNHAGGGGGGGKCHPVFGCAAVVHATWAESYADEQALFNAADLVADVTVVSSALDRFVGGRRGLEIPISRVVLRVNNVFSGGANPVIVLEQTRGPNFEIGDDPGYVPGDGYVLYLRRTTTGAYRIVNPAGRIRK
jgi:hypothetical protein